jgi:hypothetical protein
MNHHSEEDAMTESQILNLTQHTATPDQLAAGVVEPDADSKKEIQRLLTIDELPTEDELRDRAEKITEIAMRLGARRAMIGGAPFLMGYLEHDLKFKGVWPVYAFSKREVIEVTAADGKVEKKAIFKHAGWVPAAV